MSNLSQFITINRENICLDLLCVNQLTICENGSVLFNKNIEIPNELGLYFGGGYVICKASSVSWIVAPRCAEVSTSFCFRGLANTTANTCTGCTGWFVPSSAQLPNPGYTCRTYWDCFTPGLYLSDTSAGYTSAWAVNFSTGASSLVTRTDSFRVRSFRCVTY